MGFSGVRCVGLIIVVMTLVICGMCFVFPYWISAGPLNFGLLGTCFDYLKLAHYGGISSPCVWLWDNDFLWEKNLEGWQYASQAMFALGILALVIATPCACVSVCCDSRNIVSKITGCVLVASGVFILISLMVYGVFTARDFDIVPFYDKSHARFYWAYYLALVGVVLNFVAGGLFIGTKERSAKHCR